MIALVVFKQHTDVNGWWQFIAKDVDGVKTERCRNTDDNRIVVDAVVVINLLDAIKENFIVKLSFFLSKPYNVPMAFLFFLW